MSDSEQTIIVSAEVKNDITHNKPSDQNGQPKESDEDEAQDDDNSQEELIVAQENQADGQNTELSTTEKEEIENLYEKSTKEETTQEEPEQESSIHEPDSDSDGNVDESTVETVLIAAAEDVDQSGENEINPQENGDPPASDQIPDEKVVEEKTVEVSSNDNEGSVENDDSNENDQESAGETSKDEEESSSDHVIECEIPAETAETECQLKDKDTVPITPESTKTPENCQEQIEEQIEPTAEGTEEQSDGDKKNKKEKKFSIKKLKKSAKCSIS